MDLAVPVHRAVGRGEHEHVRRALIVGRCVGRDLGARATDPDVVGRGHLARNCDDGPPSVSAMSGVSNEKPVENVSVSSTSPAPPAAAASTIGARWAKLASRSCQAMSCWMAATRSTVMRTPSPGAVGGLVDHVEPLAAREPDEVSSVLGTGVEHLVRDRDHPAPLGKASGRTPCRHPSGRPSGCRRW